MKMIYIASPYTSKEGKSVEWFRYYEVTRIAAELTKIYGYALFLPITQSHAMVRHVPELGTGYSSWVEIDRYMVEKSDELWVIMLDGWKESVGVTDEIQHATKLGKPVIYVDPANFRNNNIDERL